MQFMLDTDIVSYWLRGNPRVHREIEAHRKSDLCLSAVTVAELRFGAFYINSSTLHEAIDAFTRAITILPFDEACAIDFGRIASELKSAGTPIGDVDTMIAAHARTLNLTLVTNNIRHFSRVPGLRLENWL